MDILLLVAGIACLFAGLAGAVLPLPGPALSFAGLLLLHISKFAEFSQTTLYTLGFITVVIAVLDYYIPIWGTKKFGGTRYGAIGATLGLLAGFLFYPGYRNFHRNISWGLTWRINRRGENKSCLQIRFGFIRWFSDGNYYSGFALSCDDWFCSRRTLEKYLIEEEAHTNIFVSK